MTKKYFFLAYALLIAFIVMFTFVAIKSSETTIGKPYSNVYFENPF